MAGRYPIPTKLQELRGNPGKRKLNQFEPQPSIRTPTMPSWLSVDAKAEWKKIVPELKKLGILTIVDRVALGAYCQAYAELLAATELINRHGRLLTSDGKVFANPACQLQKSAFDTVHKFLTQFGLTPASRSRLTAEPGAHGSSNPLDEIAEALRGRREPSAN